MAQAIQSNNRRQNGSGALSLAGWLRQHRASVVEAWVNFSAERAANLVSILVIGVTLAIPLLLHVAHHNVTAVVGQLDSSAQATLFMDREATLEDANKLARRLRSDRRLGEITLIDKASALAEFSEISGLQTAIGSLPTNPLPHTLVIAIKDKNLGTSAAQQIEADLRQNPLVEHVELDLSWVRKLNAFSLLVSRCVAVFAFILGLGIVLITANTIKESIFSRRAEIEVFRLCGATDGFVRRPLLYRGALQGLAGALVAIIVVFGSIAALKFPAETLSNIYDSEFQLLNLPSFSIVSALFFGAALGWAGAWHAVSLHLRRSDVLEL